MGVRRASHGGQCPPVLALLGSLRSALRTRTDLTLENLALRQQLAPLRRRSKRLQFGRLDRLLWVWLSKQWAGWREALHLVRPETVIRWHRQGFRAFWIWKSRHGGVGRPRVGSRACRSRAHYGAAESPLGRPAHSRRVAQARPRRLTAHGCPAHAVSPEATLSDLAHVPSKSPRRPRLRRLLRRAGDLPGTLYVFVVLLHHRRQVVHFNVTDSPTAAWTAQQVVEAFPDDLAPLRREAPSDACLRGRVRSTAASWSATRVPA